MFQAIKALFRQRNPDPDWFTKDIPTHTPDLSYLEMRPFWRVFIPDEIMKSHFKSELLGEGAVLRCHAFTQGRFSVWRKKLGKASQIIPLETKFTTMPYATIRGELWKVPTETIVKKLDSYKLNGIQFNRKRVSLNIPISNEMNKEAGDHSYLQVKRELANVKAWMYVGNHDFWHHKLINGSKITYKKNGELVAVGRCVDGTIYIPVGNYKPKNTLLEDYYYYSTTDNVGDS